MYELLNEIKETYVMQLPQGQDRPYARDIWYEEVCLLKKKLEEKFGITITDEDLRRAVRVRNEQRKALCEMYELQALCPSAHARHRDDAGASEGYLYLRPAAADLQYQRAGERG